MIAKLAQLRLQRTSPAVNSEFDPGDPRRLNHLSLGQQKKRAKELLKEVRIHNVAAIARWHRNGPQPFSANIDPRLSDA